MYDIPTNCGKFQHRLKLKRVSFFKLQRLSHGRKGRNILQGLLGWNAKSQHLLKFQLQRNSLFHEIEHSSVVYDVVMTTHVLLLYIFVADVLLYFDTNWIVALLQIYSELRVSPKCKFLYK